jgi:very-short-patch-repair endonuclease
VRGKPPKQKDGGVARQGPKAYGAGTIVAARPHASRIRVVDTHSQPATGGFKFVRQVPIGRYYVDFVCRDRHLIVEIDGGQHAERLTDRKRDGELCALGCRVVRVWNNDVIDNLDGVLQMLQSELEKSPLTPALSPQAGRGR